MGERARILMDFRLPLPACCRGHGKREAEVVGHSVIEPARRLGATVRERRDSNRRLICDDAVGDHAIMAARC